MLASLNRYSLDPSCNLQMLSCFLTSGLGGDSLWWSASSHQHVPVALRWEAPKQNGTQNDMQNWLCRTGFAQGGVPLYVSYRVLDPTCLMSWEVVPHPLCRGEVDARQMLLYIILCWRLCALRWGDFMLKGCERSSARKLVYDSNFNNSVFFWSWGL